MLAVQEPATHLTPETIFEQRWAMALLDRAMLDLGERDGALGRAGEVPTSSARYLVERRRSSLPRSSAWSWA